MMSWDPNPQHRTLPSPGACNREVIAALGSALNLNVHFHILIPDGVYLTDTGPPYLKALSAPTTMELQTLVQRISERIGRHLEHRITACERRSCPASAAAMDQAKGRGLRCQSTPR
jgi:putative transposase